MTGSQLPTSFQVDAYQLSHSDIADSPIDTQYSSGLTRPVGFAVSSLPRHCGMRETDRLPASLASSTAESEPRPALLTTIVVDHHIDAPNRCRAVSTAAAACASSSTLSATRRRWSRASTPQPGIDVQFAGGPGHAERSNSTNDCDAHVKFRTISELTELIQ